MVMRTALNGDVVAFDAGHDIERVGDIEVLVYPADQGPASAERERIAKWLEKNYNYIGVAKLIRGIRANELE
jgi:hypothetical protein